MIFKYSIFMYDRKIAVIDIGSNSVRLVLYYVNDKTFISIYNEKSLCYLAKGMSNEGGYLNNEGIELAKKTLLRFASMIKISDITLVKIFATSAVRDAKDGKIFMKDVSDIFNLEVKTLSGKDEAIYIAQGVLNTIYNACGLILELGGGSLEISVVDKGEIDRPNSIPIGIARLEFGNHRSCKEAIEYYLNGVSLSDLPSGVLYAAGGFFRTIAIRHMKSVMYPINIVHHYSVSVSELTKTLDKIIGCSMKNPKKGSHALLYSAFILRAVIDRAKVNKVVFSIFGLREGVLLSSAFDISNIDREKLSIHRCLKLIKGNDSCRKIANTIYKWVNPIFINDNQEYKYIRKMACIFVSMPWEIFEDHKCTTIFYSVLNSSFISVDHRMRIILAFSILLYYKDNADISNIKYSYCISPCDLKYAKLLGAVLRLVKFISLDCIEVSKFASLKIDDSKIIVSFNKKVKHLITEIVTKQLNSIATICCLEPRIVIGH